MINLNIYDSINEKVDKTKTWIDVNKHLLLSREIKFRNYYMLTKRFNPELSNYDYFIILLDYKPDGKEYHHTKLDDYGRVKIRLLELYRESDLNYLEKDSNINIRNIEHQDDGDVYQLDI